MVDSRQKGYRFERFIAKVLIPFVPGARRGAGQSQNPREADVEGSPFFRIQAKHWEKIGYSTLRKWIAKEHKDGLKYEDYRIPVVIMKRNREEPLVAMALSAFMRIHELVYGDQREDAEVHEL